MSSSFKPKQKMLRANSADVDLINEKAEALNCSAAEVISQLCDSLRHKDYLRNVSESIDYMLEHPEIVAEHRALIEEWDTTSSDGLENA